MAGVEQVTYRNAGGGTVEWSRDRDIPASESPGFWRCFGCSERGQGDKGEANSHARACHAR